MPHSPLAAGWIDQPHRLHSIGNLALQAIQQRDFPMIQGTVVVIAVVFTLVNFLVDLTYAALDPRVKY